MVTQEGGTEDASGKWVAWHRERGGNNSQEIAAIT
jgi:hypothetical protein